MTLPINKIPRIIHLATLISVLHVSRAQQLLSVIWPTKPSPQAAPQHQRTRPRLSFACDMFNLVNLEFNFETLTHPFAPCDWPSAPALRNDFLRAPAFSTNQQAQCIGFQAKKLYVEL